jgi:SAM-dependent methyltransferase
MKRHDDGSAGDANYGVIGKTYSHYRRPDAHIAAFIDAALGDAKTVLNVGAGAGSYEPTTRTVTAVEPSESMRAQRPAHLSVAIDATAEKLPFENKSFDAAMATFTVHQWSDLEAGLAEMRRVTRGPILILSCDPTELYKFWLDEYCHEALAVEATRYPAIDRLKVALGDNADVLPVPIPLDCVDGFNEAYYGRPEMLLDPGARLSCSAWSFVDEGVISRFTAHLAGDLDSGEWDRRHGALRTQPTFDGSLKLIVAHG